MNYIDLNLEKIIQARDNHYNLLKYIIKKKLNGKDFTERPPIAGMIIKKINKINRKVAKKLNDDEFLKKVLIGTPKDLDEIKDSFKTKHEIKSINLLINYDQWIKKSSKSYCAYDMAEILDIPTCIYCNRMYTKTVITRTKQKITRPTFDHWFPKSQYPLLALSFYNLIPCCSVCNSGTKGTTPFSISTHFHPYDPNINFQYKFSYNHLTIDKFSVKIKTSNEFSKTSVNAFELEEIYKAHQDEIYDLIMIKKAYSETYIKMLEQNILGGIALKREDVYRLAFGVHLEEAKFNRRPLSKLKYDILSELGII